jgi:ATP adenylyltransferase
LDVLKELDWRDWLLSFAHGASKTSGRIFMAVLIAPKDSFDYSNGAKHCQTPTPELSTPYWPSVNCYLLLDMDFIFTPWRYAYVTGADKTQKCVFCAALELGDDPRAGIIHRGHSCFIILNTYPYTSGHVMVVPYQHADQLQKLDAPATHEMMDLAHRLEGILRELYHPDGLNIGINLGKAAGAGVASHLHMHVLPRWVADANFMTVVGETRVLPEDLETTYARIRVRFNQ